MIKPLKYYSLIIFDCDGTLVNTEEIHARAIAELLTEEGIQNFDATRIYREFMGLKLTDTLKILKQETGHDFPPDMGPRYIQRVTDTITNTVIPPIKHVEALIEKAQSQSKTCIGSNGQRDNVLKSLINTKLKSYFADDHIFTAIEVENPKPAPDLYLHAAQKMGEPAQNCLVFEDSPLGVRAGVAAGMDVIGYTGSHTDPQNHGELLKEAGAKFVTSSYQDIIKDF